MRIVWSMGDPHGIGPEIILRSFLKLQESGHTFLVTGSQAVLEHYNALYDLRISIQSVTTPSGLMPCCQGTLPVLSTGEPRNFQPGTISAEAGELAVRSVIRAAELCRDGYCDALTTAPLHKEALSRAGYTEHGHTEILGNIFGIIAPTMLFVDPVSDIRVALATIHQPIQIVPELIRNMKLDHFLTNLARSLTSDFALAKPSIAILGLNPHASDGGIMGTEEQEIIEPAIRRLATTINISGPFPADGFFGAGLYRNYDCTVAMYHDQGLLPFKLLAFETGVNVTLGLPIIRTSPDHGTGFDITGQGIASKRSFIEATRMAISIAENRRTANHRHHDLIY